MTCIVGIETEGGVIMGADSAGVAGLKLEIRGDEKVCRSGRIVMGFTSSFRMGQLVRFALPNIQPETSDLSSREAAFEWAVTKFIPHIRKVLADGGFREKKDEVESGGTFLVGVGPYLFAVGDDFQVAHRLPVRGVLCNACGCGEDAALGAIYGITQHLPNRDYPDAHRLIGIALETAMLMSAGVRGPFVVMDNMGEAS